MDHATPSAHTPNTTVGREWAKFYVDGGLVMSARDRRRIIGVYWSMRLERPGWQTVIRRRRDMHARTNNDAEWLALLEALQYACDVGLNQPMVIYSDSQLIVNQFNRSWRSKIARHHHWRDTCWRLAAKLPFVVVEWRPRRVMVQKLGH